MNRHAHVFPVPGEKALSTELRVEGACRGLKCSMHEASLRNELVHFKRRALCVFDSSYEGVTIDSTTVVSFAVVCTRMGRCSWSCPRLLGQSHSGVIYP